MVFHILETAGSGKITPQNDHKNGFTLGDLRYAYTSDNWKCPKTTFFFFLTLFDENSISRGVA